MKKILLLIIGVFVCLSCIMVSAESDIMKISMSGETKLAKDVGAGKGITFTLPDIEDDEFYIYAIELAVFEKHYEDANWHIYTDDNGNETKKKYIENPESLTFNVDFGDTSAYRDMSKYKIGYRYYVQSIYDASKLLVAGEDIKDGWRLVGETETTSVSDGGFVFYKNAIPTMQIECFSYMYHTVSGLMTNSCSPSELSTRYFPKDAFDNGVTIQMVANDFDKEDILTVSYKLEDAITDTIVSSGELPADSKIKTAHKTEVFRLYITVSDNFGGSITSYPYLLMMDLEEPAVTSSFDDGGYALKGKNLFSDFYVDDDAGFAMESGSVFADIYIGGGIVGTTELSYMGNGVYRLDETGI